MSEPGGAQRGVRDDSSEGGRAPTEAVGGKVIRGSIWAFAGQVLPQFYTFVTSVVAARMLGAEGLGQLTFISFTAATLGTLLTLGFPASIARHVAESIGAGRGYEIRRLYRAGWLFGIVVASIALAALWLVAALGAEPRAGWLFAGVTAAGLVLHQIPSVLLIGASRFRDAMIVGTTTGSIALVVRVPILLGGGGVVDMLAIDAAVGLANVLFTTLLARRALERLAPRSRRASDIVRRAARFGLVGSLGVVITWVVFRRSEIFILGHYSTKEQIAIYSIPYTIVATLLFLPKSVTYVLSPTFATLYGAGEVDRMRDGFGRSLRIVTLSTFILAALGFVAGPSALLLFYGPEFEESGLVLRILLVTFPLVPLMALSDGLVRSMGRQWVATGVIAAAAAFNIALAVVLIREFDAIGAAVANSAAQVVASLPLVAYAVRVLGRVDFGGTVLARGGLVTAAAAGIALPLTWILPPGAALLASTAVFSIAFLGLALIVPVMTPSDARALSVRVGGRARGLPRSVLAGISGRQAVPE